MTLARRSFLAGLLATPVAACVPSLAPSGMFDLGSDGLTAISIGGDVWVAKTAEEIYADIRECLRMLMEQNLIYGHASLEVVASSTGSMRAVEFTPRINR